MQRLSQITCPINGMPLLVGFDLWLRAAGYRPQTIERALRTARSYTTFCNSDNPLSRQAAIGYLASLSLRVKRITLEGRHKDLCLLDRWAMSEGLQDRSFMEGIPRAHPSVDERERDAPTYTEADIRALLAVTPSWTWIGLRDQALILTLWHTPFRASEVCALLVTDVDWETGEMMVRDGKGGSRYQAVMPEALALAVERYLRHRPHDVAMLYVDQRGGLLTPHALALMLRRMAIRARLMKPIYPHAFRHNFRQRCRALGLDDADIAALLGHRSITATWGYARKAAREMAKSRLRERLAAP